MMPPKWRLLNSFNFMIQALKRKEHTINAEGEILGRLASRIAVLLRGKHKPEFERNLDLGDTVIVENVDKIKVTGNKFNDKIYYKSSDRPGGKGGFDLYFMGLELPE